MLKPFLKEVPFSQIRHNDLSCYRAEGFGGAPIEKWPVYAFYLEYLGGNKEKAYKDFLLWYEVQLNKYHAVSKGEGGMYNGSLYTLITERCGKPYIDTEEQCRKSAIEERVEQRLKLLEAMRAEGYMPEKAERIDAVRRGGSVYLQGGHHRAAALRALGAETLPGVLVFPHQFFYNLFTLLRKIKYAFQK